MAERIEGLSIGLDLDTIKIDSGLKDLKGKISLVNSEMKANMSAFDRGKKSVGKYETQLSGLNKKLEVQADVTDKARTHYEKMVKEYGEGSKEAEKAAVAYNNQAAQLNNLKRHIGRVTDEMEEFKRQNSTLYKTGDALTNFGSGLEKVSKKAMGVGKGLTKWITLPAIGVATALGGITAALGWGRLVGLDSAQAQLKGLGYTTKEVGRISDQVTTAIDGGMTTMAEGTAVAAGGLAAGVKEGKELERYIKLVGDAAVGSNRPVADMAQIFNRVQGSGKLMTMELNSIEQGMPGFAQAMAKSLGVSQEKFREMVTAGEVDSKKFMDVMESFAGGMASAYSDSWQGMVANTKAYIGIIGENLLGGVFEKSKESIAEFIDILKSDAVIDWATEMGQKIGETFTNIVDKVKGTITWFTGLDKSTRGLIVKLGGIAIAAGPLIMGLAGVGGVIAKVSSGLGSLMTSIANAGGFMGILSRTAKDGTKKVGLLARVLTLLTGPVGVAIGVIAALATGFVIAYKKSETFREMIGKAVDGVKKGIETIKGVFKLFSTDMSAEYISGIDIISKYLPRDAAKRVVKIVDGVKDQLGTLKESFDKVSEGVKKGVELVGGVFKLFSQDMSETYISGVDIISKFLPPDKAKAVVKTVDGIKKNIHDALHAIASFFKEKIGEITSFWDNEGSGLLEAFSNIFSGIWKVTKPIIDAIVSLIKISLPIIQGIFKVTFFLILEIVKMVWSNIKGVIDGGLKFIQGLIQVFSGIFTGDFSKMWEGIKNIFSGAIQFIWNFVQLMFWGKLIKGALSFVKLFGSAFKSMWNGIRSVFSSVIKWIVEFVKNRFTSMKNTIDLITSTTRSIISKIWNGILSFFKNIIKGIVDFVKTRFTNMKNNTTNQFNAVKDMALRVWNGVKNNIVNPVKNAIKTAKDKFNGFKTSVSTTFKNIKDNVSGYVSDMVQKVKDMPGNMKQGIVDGAGKVKEGMLSLGRKMVDGLAAGVNGIFAAIDWVLGKFGADKKGWKWTPSEKLSWYAKGTGGHPGGDAVMGDGTGSNAGSELVNLPNGKSFLSADKPTLYPNLPKGTEVFPAKLTRQIIPHYKDGIFSKIGKGVKSGYNTMKGGMDAAKSLGKVGAKKGKDVALNVWDYAKKPGKLLNLALSKLGIGVPDASTLLGQIAKGGFNYAKTSAVDYVKDIFKKEEEAGGGPAPSGGASGWRQLIMRAAGRMGQSISSGEINGIIKQIQRESGGNQSIVQSKAVRDINTLMGNPARGLLQYIPQTFGAYKVPGHGNINSGYDQLLAFFNNKNWRKDLPYGKRGWGPTGGRQYKQGTNYVPEDGPAFLHKGEAVVPKEYNKPARTNAMKLLALVGKEIQENKRHKKQSKNNNGRSEELSLLKQQVQLLTELVLSSRNIEDKPVISDGDIKHRYDKRDSRESAKHSIFTGRPGGAY